MHDVADKACEFPYRQILAGADVDVHELAVVQHEEYAGVGQIVDV